MLSPMRKSLITLTAAVVLTAVFPGFALASGRPLPRAGTGTRGTSYTLADVSCAGAAGCPSVGGQAQWTKANPAGTSRDLAQAWNGTRWRPLATPH